MLQGEGVADFPKDTLFEVSAILRRKGEHGEYAELTYVTTMDGRRQSEGSRKCPCNAAKRWTLFDVLRRSETDGEGTGLPRHIGDACT